MITVQANIHGMLVVNTKHSILKYIKFSKNWYYSNITHVKWCWIPYLIACFHPFALFYVASSYPNPQYWTATFGVSTMSPRLRVRVRAILAHDGYSSVTRDNDIAVVQLDRSVAFSRNIHRVCLPAATQNIIPGSVAYVTGWGSLTYGGK
jgi:hypothetical protein